MNSNARHLIGRLAVLIALSPLTAVAAPPSSANRVAHAILAAGQAPGGSAERQATELLGQARKALREGRLDLAEIYIDRAERLDVRYDPLMAEYQDTPQKLRRELAQARTADSRGPQLPSSRFEPSAPDYPQTDTPYGGSFTPNSQEDALSKMTDRSQAYPATASPLAISPDQIPESAADRLPPLGPTQPAGDAIRSPYQLSEGASGIGGAAPRGGVFELRNSGADHSQSGHLLLEARRALAFGDIQAAGRFVQQAKALGASYPPHGDSPEKIEALLRTAGQFTRPPQPGVDPNEHARALADFMLQQADGLLRYKDLAGAEQLAERAKTLPVDFGNSQLTPDNLLAQIAAQRTAGQTAGAAQLTSGSIGDLPSGQFAGAENASPAKAEALRLAAQSQAALDRGDLMQAHRLARQAQDLHVPDREYSAGDIRPWQLLLKVEGVMRDRGISPAQTASYDVQDAGYAAQNEQRDFAVSRGVYNPEADHTRNVAAQAQSPIEAEPPAAADSTGARLYRMGLEALQAGQRDQALDLFRQAWQHRDDLNPTVLAQLKDKLNLMQSANLAPPIGQGPSTLETVSAEQQLLRQKLFREIATEQKNAEQMAQQDPKGALEHLKSLRDRVAQSGLDAAPRKQLLTIVDRSVDSLQQYIDQNEPAIELAARNKRILEEIEQGRVNTYDVQNKLAQLVDQFNELMDEQRFAEAEVIAKQARELAPYDSIVTTLEWKSKFARRLIELQSIKSDKEEGVYQALANADRSAIPFDDNNPYVFPEARDWQELSEFRQSILEKQANRLSPEEQQIQQSLGKKVEVRFTDRPLSEVLETLSVLSGVPIHADPQGLAAEGVTTASPVTLNLQQPISLRSALNLILQPMRLSYVIQNEVLQITSETARNSDTYPDVYNVADLVIPIPNFVPSYDIGIPGALKESYNAMGYGQQFGGFGGPTPLTLAVNDANQNSAISPLALAQMGGGSMAGRLGSRAPQTVGFGPGGLGGGSQADFDSLIELITTTIAPDSWDEVGGPGAIAPFETNLSLVVSQTQEIHDQIADLLRQLRRLQDLQVTIEVRFITISDLFFERIGVDFDFEIDDNSGLRPQAPEIPDDDGQSIVIGLDETGAPTADLDLQINQNTLGVAVPQFGGFQAANATNFGFAILSDIEAFFLVQAAQGDSRTNVLQAPKVTLFNGQSANVSDTSQRPFVTSIIPVVGDFAAAHQPVIMVLNEGTSMNVQAVVSPDRRFVRLTLVPFFSSIGNVETFTFSGTTTTNSGTTVLDPDGNPVDAPNNMQIQSNSGTTVQLPQFNFTTVTTTVSVPDGGTVLLGGIKRLSEGRNERGLPLLSKVPYVNRLFRNVGIGRETQSLMMMVTPRIIIQEEEEEKLGFPPPE